MKEMSKECTGVRTTHALGRVSLSPLRRAGKWKQTRKSANSSTRPESIKAGYGKKHSLAKLARDRNKRTRPGNKRSWRRNQAMQMSFLTRLARKPFCKRQSAVLLRRALSDAKSGKRKLVTDASTCLIRTFSDANSDRFQGLKHRKHITEMITRLVWN